MNFSKLDIYSKEWMDQVFVNRNKEYGAYQLRQMSGKATNIALFAVLIAALIFSSISLIKGKNINTPPEIPKESTTIAMIEPEDIHEDVIITQDEKPEKVQQVAQDVSAKDVVKFTEINPTSQPRTDDDVADVSTIMDKKVVLGPISAKGLKGGELITKGTFGTEKRDGGHTGTRIGDPTGIGNTDQPMEFVEVMPEPVGGMKAFIQWIAQNYQFPQSAADDAVQGLVQVSFVVEKDGSLSSFVVKKDMGYGTGEQAVRLLQKAKKWNPGYQNGVKVRVAFTLPIRLNTTN